MFKLPDLPYDYAALQPTISDDTMRLHHDKHHAAYVTTLNGLLPDGDSKDRLAAAATALARDTAPTDMLQTAPRALP